MSLVLVARVRNIRLATENSVNFIKDITTEDMEVTEVKNQPGSENYF